MYTKGTIPANAPFKEDYNTLLGITGNAIYNGETMDHLINTEFFKSIADRELNVTKEYCEYARQWITTSKLNNFTGIEDFPYAYPSVGVSHQLDELHYYCLRNNLRLRMFKGEFPYNYDRHNFKFGEDWVENGPLEKNDLLLVSVPFSANGNKPNRFEETLDEAETKGVKVFLDIAWFGTCNGIDIALNHPAVEWVGFSTTKSLSCGDYRNGVRFSRHPYDDSLSITAKWGHGVHLNNAIGLELMQNFSPDTQWNKYNKKAKQVCEHYGLTLSNAVHIAIGGPGWEYFSRNGTYNRVNIRYAVKKLKL